MLLIGCLFILRQITVTKGMEYIDLVSVQSSGTPGCVWESVARVVPQRKDGSSASKWEIMDNQNNKCPLKFISIVFTSVLTF